MKRVSDHFKKTVLILYVEDDKKIIYHSTLVLVLWNEKSNFLCETQRWEKLGCVEND